MHTYIGPSQSRSRIAVHVLDHLTEIVGSLSTRLEDCPRATDLIVRGHIAMWVRDPVKNKPGEILLEMDEPAGSFVGGVKGIEAISSQPDVESVVGNVRWIGQDPRGLEHTAWCRGWYGRVIGNHPRARCLCRCLDIGWPEETVQRTTPFDNPKVEITADQRKALMKKLKARTR